MYFVQGEIAERLTDNSWEQNIEQHFFEPLQMTSSTANIEGLKNGKNAALGYYFENGKTTEIDYKGDAKLSGRLAMMGQRIIGGVINSLSKQFFDALDKEINH